MKRTIKPRGKTLIEMFCEETDIDRRQVVITLGVCGVSVVYLHTTRISTPVNGHPPLASFLWGFVSTDGKRDDWEYFVCHQHARRMLSPHAQAFMIQNLLQPSQLVRKKPASAKLTQGDRLHETNTELDPYRSLNGDGDADFRPGRLLCTCHDAELMSLCRHPSVVTITDAYHVHGVSAELCQADLWQAFHHLHTEMIITKTGRRMFPAFRVYIRGLKPDAVYRVSLEFSQCGTNKYRYVYQSSKWMVAGVGEEERRAADRTHVHSDSPVFGGTLMSQAVSFEKVKLTNARRSSPCQVTLTSMQMFQPVLHVQRVLEGTGSDVDSPERMTFIFPQTSFMAVTAYQNQEITRLKIARNPFAKGFREGCMNKNSFQLPDDRRQMMGAHLNFSFTTRLTAHPRFTYMSPRDGYPPRKRLRHDVTSTSFPEPYLYPETPTADLPSRATYTHAWRLHDSPVNILPPSWFPGVHMFHPRPHVVPPTYDHTTAVRPPLPGHYGRQDDLPSLNTGPFHSYSAGKDGRRGTVSPSRDEPNDLSPNRSDRTLVLSVASRRETSESSSSSKVETLRSSFPSQASSSPSRNGTRDSDRHGSQMPTLSSRKETLGSS